MPRVPHRRSIWGAIIIGLFAVLSWLGVKQSHDKYKGNLIPVSPDPCSPDAPVQVRDTQNSRWPIERSRDERCPPKEEAATPEPELQNTDSLDD